MGILQARILEWVEMLSSSRSSQPMDGTQVCMHAKSLQLRPILCDPMDSSPPGSSVHKILQARILEWVAISFSNACSHFSYVQLCVTQWTAAHQAPLSTGLSRQEYWSGLSFPSPIHACMLSRFSHVQLCATLWTAAHQAPLSMGFSRQEYWLMEN